MLAGPIRTASLLASLFVLLGFGLFAVDETRDASSRSATEVAGRAASQTTDPTPDQERAREQAHGSVREAIDDANDVLLSPFAPLADDAESQWWRRLVPALIALLVYGVGGGYLSRVASVRS